MCEFASILIYVKNNVVILIVAKFVTFSPKRKLKVKLNTGLQHPKVEIRNSPTALEFPKSWNVHRLYTELAFVKISRPSDCTLTLLEPWGNYTFIVRFYQLTGG